MVKKEEVLKYLKDRYEKYNDSLKDEFDKISDITSVVNFRLFMRTMIELYEKLPVDKLSNKFTFRMKVVFPDGNKSAKSRTFDVENPFGTGIGQIAVYDILKEMALKLIDTKLKEEPYGMLFEMGIRDFYFIEFARSTRREPLAYEFDLKIKDLAVNELCDLSINEF